ncbi:MAG: AI-2E family transporter [Heliobacteriaceae bacterium]|nr:AI-2E family transporter [Heliobacteriaceae bacterium]MDD4587139.1 AI-2E family transporter [Heliobacteriaceae bacterium]
MRVDGRRRLFLVTGLALSVLVFAYLARGVLVPFFLAGTIAYVLHPAVLWLERRGFSRVWAILGLFGLVFGGTAGLIAVGFPRIVGELNRFSAQLPVYTTEIQNLIAWLQQSMVEAGFPPGVQQVWGETLARGEETLLAMVRWVLNGAVSLAANAIDVVLIPVMTFYFLKDWEMIGQEAARLAPHRFRPDVLVVAGEVDKVLKAVIRGHLLISLIVGGLTTLGMLLIGMDYSLLIGIVAGIADLIPYFGPIIGMFPAVVLGLLESPRLALWAVGVMILIQQVESNLISPKIMADSVGLHPLAVIFALLTGGHFFGVLGLLLAVPVVVVGKVICRYVFLKVLV